MKTLIILLLLSVPAYAKTCEDCVINSKRYEFTFECYSLKYARIRMFCKDCCKKWKEIIENIGELEKR